MIVFTGAALMTAGFLVLITGVGAAIKLGLELNAGVFILTSTGVSFFIGGAILVAGAAP